MSVSYLQSWNLFRQDLNMLAAVDNPDLDHGVICPANYALYWFSNCLIKGYLWLLSIMI